MNITIEKYNPNWESLFLEQKNRISDILNDFSLQIEHIGSTAVPFLSSKPIIDIAIGVQSKHDLDRIIQKMIDNQFVYISAFNSMMPERRFFVYLKNREKFQSEYAEINNIPNEKLHINTIAHIHTWVLNSSEWTRHIVFREYLKVNSDVRNEYQELKEMLSTKHWSDGNEYSNAKNEFIKSEEAKVAISV